MIYEQDREETLDYVRVSAMHESDRVEGFFYDDGSMHKKFLCTAIDDAAIINIVKRKNISR